jgi:hypothetical protein
MESDTSKEINSTEPYWFSKEKIPAKLSYPLKRSLLDNALRSAGVYGAVYSVRYLGRTNSRAVMDASLVPLGTQAHRLVQGRSLITVWAVPKEQRHAAEQILAADALPRLCAWLARTQAEGNAWRGFRHAISFQIDEGNLNLVES